MPIVFVELSQLNQNGSGLYGIDASNFTLTLSSSIKNVTQVKVLNARYNNVITAPTPCYPIITCGFVQPSILNNNNIDYLYIIENLTDDTNPYIATAHNNTQYILPVASQYVDSGVYTLAFRVQSSVDGSAVLLDDLKICLMFF